MGLAAPQRRNKISHDPNNTTWSKSTNAYGQKILSAQGWKPGDYLGAENANHGDHYTAANASHIRILLREDNLGLGAQVGKTNAETFGLSLFSGVLGRLNGKSDEEIERQQGALRDAELRTYQSNKYGFMNFVSGGVLVGDMIEPSKSQQIAKGDKQSSTLEIGESKEKVKKWKKRDDPTKSKSTKAVKMVNATDEFSAVEKEASKRKQRKQGSLPEPNASNEDHIPHGPQRRLGKEPEASERDTDADFEDKKAQKKHKKARHEDATEQESTTSSKSERSRLKSERRARREERRKRKEERRRSKLSRDDGAAEDTSNETSQVETTAAKNPALLSQGNRHAVRRRYIEQKRMTSMNPQAMKEIFMLQATA